MTTLLLATQNRGKATEFMRLFHNRGQKITLKALTECDHAEMALAALAAPEPYNTFWENAQWKAQQVSQATGQSTLADDSGLAVDALGGAPGVRSARYAADKLGIHIPPEERDQQNNTALLTAMQHTPNRGCSYIVVLALVLTRHDYENWMGAGAWEQLPLKKESPEAFDGWFLDHNRACTIVQGSWHGQIALSPSGTNGFGYDPLVIVGPNNRTAADLSAAEKNERSHRAKAVDALVEAIERRRRKVH